MSENSQNIDSGAENEESGDQKTVGRHLVYYAAERTLMAWIRSALGLMALGFVIDRFGLILQQAPLVQGGRFHPRLFSFWTGTAMVTLGTFMAVTAAVRYWRFSIAFHRIGTSRPGHGILVGVIYTLILALIGVVIIFFLVVAMD